MDEVKMVWFVRHRILDYKETNQIVSTDQLIKRLGISKTTYRNILNGDNITTETIRRIAKVLRIKDYELCQPIDVDE